MRGLRKKLPNRRVFVSKFPAGGWYFKFTTLSEITDMPFSKSTTIRHGKNQINITEIALSDEALQAMIGLYKEQEFANTVKFEIRKAVKDKYGSYWYLTTVYECPVCGKGRTEKVRQYTPKPSHPKDRWVYATDAESYDHCEE